MDQIFDHDECIDQCGNSGQLGQLVSCIASDCKVSCWK
jgi:hypothetical protein